MENLRTFEDHILSYDRRHRNVNWVFEHLTRAKVKWNDTVDRVQCDFQTDQAIHPYFASTNEDYKLLN